MRIITGIAKGKRLATSEGLDVRPTPERVKEALFSAIQFDIEGRTILDLFAGSGQIGLEALSRGASRAVFVDNSISSVEVINRNIKNTGFEDKAKVIKGDYSAVLMGLEEKFDFAFLDPPYASGLLTKALLAVQKNINKYGLVICEHPKEQKLETEIGDFTIKKQYKYGKVFLTVYKRKGVDDE